MGDDGSDLTTGYMRVGDVPFFKVFDSSEEIFFDMIFFNYYPKIGENYHWGNLQFFTIDQLINDDYSFTSNMSNFQYTANITSVFDNDTYQMGANDILVSYFEETEIRGISKSSNNIFPTWPKLFLSSIHLDETINNLSFKYYNYEYNLIFNIKQSFSSVYADSNFGSAIHPIILNIDGDDIVLGCTDPSDSNNYNPDANVDDGSCMLSIANNQLVSNFVLIDAYPNPFNPFINITLDIKDNDYLDINIIDSNGLEVNKVFKGYKAAGKYDYQWDASSFSSGIYFIIIKKLKNKDVIFKKICLIK